MYGFFRKEEGCLNGNMGPFYKMFSAAEKRKASL